MHLANWFATNKFIKFSIPFLLFIAFNTNANALPFNIATKAGTVLPSNVVSGHSAIAYYTVQNNTLSARNNNYVKYLPTNVTQVTTGGTYSDTCGATFNLSAHGQAGDSCTLQLSIYGPVSAPNNPALFVCFPGGLTCAGTLYPLNVAATTSASLITLNVTPSTATIYPTTTQQYSAIGTYSDNTTTNVTSSASWSTLNSGIATIAAGGLATGVASGSTSVSAVLNSVTGSTTLNVVSAPLVTATLNVNIITTNYTFNLTLTQTGFGSNRLSATLPSDMTFVGPSSCTVNQNQPTCNLIVNSGTSTGTYDITPQLISGSATVVSSPNPLAINVTAPLFMYVSDFSSNVHKCPINTATGNFISACLPMNSQETAFSDVSGVNFYTFDSQNYAYVGDNSANLWRCPLDARGNFSTICTALTNTATPFFSTRNVTFATFSGTTYAYVSDDTTTLFQCPINTVTGGFSGTCTALSVSPDEDSEIFNTTFYTFSGVTYAYVADHSLGLWQCPINSTTGGFSASCTPLINTSSPFTAAVGVTFNTFNGTTYAYVSDDSTNIWQCPMNNSTGAFSGPCTGLVNANTGFLLATGFSFKTFSDTTYAFVADQTSSMWKCSVDATTGAFGSSCTALNTTDDLNDDVIGLTFYTP